MKLRSARESCQITAFLTMSQKKLAAAKNLTGTDGTVIAAACNKAIACETDSVATWLTPAGKNASCVGFFGSDYIRSNFPWAKDCNQAQICKDYANAVTTATATPAPSAAPASLRGAALAAAAALASAFALLA